MLARSSQRQFFISLAIETMWSSVSQLHKQDESHRGPGPEVKNFLFVFSSAEHELLSVVNMKMATVVYIFMFISREISMLSCI